MTWILSVSQVATPSNAVRHEGRGDYHSPKATCTTLVGGSVSRSPSTPCPCVTLTTVFVGTDASFNAATVMLSRFSETEKSAANQESITILRFMPSSTELRSTGRNGIAVEKYARPGINPA